jgi:DNA-binding transcriptional MocR family regulator
MRLNFSNASPERIRTGIERLAEVCHAALAVAT